MDGVVVTTVTTVGTETDETTEIPETNGETTKIVGTMTATVLGMTEGTETPHVEMLQGTAIEMERMIATVVIIPDRTIDAHQKGAILPSHHEEVCSHSFSLLGCSPSVRHMFGNLHLHIFIYIVTGPSAAENESKPRQDSEVPTDGGEEGEAMDVTTVDDEAMMAMMGMSGFGSTKVSRSPE